MIKVIYRLNNALIGSLIAMSLVWSVTASAAPATYFDVIEDRFLLVVDGKTYEPTFWTGFTSHYEAFRSNEMAYELGKKAHSQAKIGSAVLWGVGFGGPMLTLAFSDGMSRSTFQGLYWGTFIGGLLTGSYYSGQANLNWLKASNHYNGVYGSASTQQAGQWSISPILDKDQFGLSWRLSF